VTGCAKPNRWHSHAGFTVFELVVSLTLIAVFVAGLLATLLYYEELAEKTVVDLTIRNIRSGLRLELARQITAGGIPDVAGLAASNPVAWLETFPQGYRGEIRSGAAADLEKGGWYFDAQRRELVYVPRLSFHFQMPAGGAPRIGWRLQMRSAGAGTGAMSWIEVVPTDYRWF